jgi:heat shock protein HtpX
MGGAASSVNTTAWRRHRLINGAQSLLLLGAMTAILAGLGWIVWEENGVFWAIGAGVVLVLLNPGLSPRLVLRMYGARRLGPGEAPELNDWLRMLAARAGLPAAPALYHVPSAMINAFAVGTRGNSAIAVTDALLRALSPRELAGGG